MLALIDLLGWALEAIIASVRLGQGRSRLQRQVARARQAEIRDLSGEHRVVRVSGRASSEAHRTFVCPATGVEVLGFHVRAELEPHEQQRVGETQLVEISVVADFTVSDDTGSAVVRGAGASLIGTGHGGARAKDQLAVDLVNPAFAQLVERQASVVDVVTSRVVGYWLHELRPGDEVTVCGRARLSLDVAGAAGGYRDAPAYTVFEAAHDAPLIVVVGRE